MSLTLNEQQQQAVFQKEGRLLILAGAGSGKTRVLMARIAHLLDHGVDPKSILGLTFTNKAAGEMRERLSKMVGAKLAKETTLSTFHSFCLRILRQNIHHLGYTQSFSIYSEYEVKRIAQQLAKSKLGVEDQLPSLSPTLSRIDQARQLGQEPAEEGNNNWHNEFCKEIYHSLKQAMRAYNAVDFNGLLELTVELFEKHPDILKEYQERYRYIMIDEYQDTNPIQDKLARLLSAGAGNLCVVGDDDQSIYGWRGADITNILRFEADHVIKLEQNYRSTATILKAATELINNNKERHHKGLWSSLGDGEPIEVFHAPSEEQEADSVVARILDFKERYGLQWKDFAIIYRSNALARPLEAAMLRAYLPEKGDDDKVEWKRGIPYQVYGGDSFYESREVKDFVAYLKVLANPNDQEAILRIINQPRRGIGEVSLDKITGYQREKKQKLWQVLEESSKEKIDLETPLIEMPSKTRQSIAQFLELFEKAKEELAAKSLPDFLKSFLESCDYERAIDEEVKSKNFRDFKKKNLKELILSAEDEELKAIADPQQRLLEFISRSQLDGGGAFANKSSGNTVSLMTFHSSKGLEFPYCFIVGLEDHIVPHEKSLEEGRLEEERRLLYVAMTRAQKKLVMSMACERSRGGHRAVSTPSRFLFEIPKGLMQVTSWK